MPTPQLPIAEQMRDAQIAALSLVAHAWRAGAQGDIAGGLAGVGEILDTADLRLVVGALAGLCVAALEEAGRDVPAYAAAVQIHLLAEANEGGQA